MEKLDRRVFLRGAVGAVTVAAVAAGAGATLLTGTAEAAPVPADKTLKQAMDDWTGTEQVQYRRYYRRPYWRGRSWRRRRRRWVCWWRRGRRVCGWRYW